LQYRNSSKLLFFESSIWRKIFFLKSKIFHEVSNPFYSTRSSVIPKSFSDQTLKIYNGKTWIKCKIKKWMIGYKFGEFTWNRKVAIYKKKQLKKKNKKKK
jgi:small subunit ribosomal protein S19